MNQLMYIGVFEDEKSLLQAVKSCRRKKLAIVDAFTPYPVHELEHEMGLRRTRLPYICFGAGLLGLAVGLLFQYWSAGLDWPLNVGGKPLDSLPAFMPVAFELMVLFAGLTTVLAFLLRARLFPGKSPKSVASRLCDDRFALVVRSANASLSADQVAELWQESGAVETREEWTEHA